jgi:hypothetical protein
MFPKTRESFRSRMLYLYDTYLGNPSEDNAIDGRPLMTLDRSTSTIFWTIIGGNLDLLLGFIALLSKCIEKLIFGVFFLFLLGNLWINILHAVVGESGISAFTSIVSFVCAAFLAFVGAKIGTALVVARFTNHSSVEVKPTRQLHNDD